MSFNRPPPMPNRIIMKSVAESKQQDMNKEYARLPKLDTIIAILIIIAVITVMILMNVFHLF